MPIRNIGNIFNDSNGFYRVLIEANESYLHMMSIFFLGNDLDSNYRFMGRYDDHINSDFYDTTRYCLQVIQKIRKRCPDCEG